MKQIVIIEDDPSIIRSYERYLRAFEEEVGCTGIFLKTLSEAEEFIDEKVFQEKNIAAVIFDGSMNSAYHKLNTRHLVRLVIESYFRGILIANSSDQNYNDALITEGCTHRSPGKAEVLKFLFELLK